MGAALDSFVITVEFAGIVAIVLLAFCLVSRHRNNSGSLNVFQRLPVLLPALGFVITIILVANLGLTPMAQYQGVNSRLYYTESGQTTTFTLRDQFMYSESFMVSGSYQSLQFNDSIYIDAYILQDDSVIETLSFDVQYSVMDYTSSGEGSIALAPGQYTIQVNFTRYQAGVLQEEPGSLQLTISQPLVEGFNTEILNWSSLQFAINVSIILVLLAGICIGSPTKKPPKEDETDWKTTTEYEY
ncbi:MAG: hypothetical protein RTU63_09155 [Candidatus Thorarchaeota archaeon]